MHEASQIDPQLTLTIASAPAAVHRLPTMAGGISRLLKAAVELTQILQDDWRAAQLEELRSEVINAMEMNENLLEDTVSRNIRQIQQKREELDRIEAELIQGMIKSPWSC
jgi:uncharacterized protein (DUF342 family)